MRLLLIILFSWCLSVSAQVIRANPYYSITNYTAPSNLLLDSFPYATAGYSLRKLDKDYSGSAIRVRRSNDNTEQDIGFVNDGLDTASLKTFVGSNNGYVVTWYDQSGNSNNLTQSTTSKQPRVILSGVIDRINSIPTVYFLGTDDFLASTTNYMSGASSGSYFAVTKIDADPPTCNNCGAILQTRTALASAVHQPYSDGNIYDGFGTNVRKSTGNPTNSLTTTYLYCAVSQTNDWKSYINNVQFYSTLTNTVSFPSTIYVGRGWDGGGSDFYYLGKVSELILYSSVPNRTGISTNINNYYSIY